MGHDFYTYTIIDDSIITNPFVFWNFAWNGFIIFSPTIMTALKQCFSVTKWRIARLAWNSWRRAFATALSSIFLQISIRFSL